MQTRWHFSDSDSAWLSAALAFVARAEQAALTARGEFHIVLAGGNTPRMVYEALARETHDWLRWRVWFGDERCLPADHPERNSVMARALLERISAASGNPHPADMNEAAGERGFPLYQRGIEVPKGRGFIRDLPTSAAGTGINPPRPPFDKGESIHTIPGELGPVKAAAAYADDLVGVGDFDLVILGLGEDGHTASLFPGYVPKPEADALAVFDAPKPPPERVSLSASRLSRARHVLFLVSGLGKREALRHWRAGTPPIPAATIQPEAGVDVLLAPDLSVPGVFP
ncbi:MAG: 6-phosphogluconolactonase [Pseudomonadota bacterium]|nr:6-phosphogluconolactonase [Pseudomonadota bacterium]